MANTGASPVRIRTLLTGLPAPVFQHPLDKAATENLKRLRGFDKLVSIFLDYGFERLQYVHNMSGAIRASERQLPTLLRILRESCHILDVPEPELYVKQGGMNAYTFGHAHPYIVLLTGLLDSMTDDELMAVISHEVGHIKCGHVLYKQMARGIAPLLEIAGKATLGIGTLLGVGVEAALLMWDRRSEFSADRAALLAVQDARPCNMVFMKLAGGSARFSGELSLEEFLAQARKYREDAEEETKLDKIYRFMAGTQANHPFPVERCHALLNWEDSTEYANILSGGYRTTGNTLEPTATMGPKCAGCGWGGASDAKFCGKCGRVIQGSGS